ncbi:MAG: 2OG-Fe(II) oxygenase [Gemmatimonadota bacterium]|nr:2OG-Fe(II) oxygenase [Gemmatimonadota bacterium]
MILKTPWAVIPGLVSEETCAELEAHGDEQQWHDAREFTGLRDEEAAVRRAGEVAWFQSQDLLDSLAETLRSANERAGWHFDLGPIEPLQYSVYGVDDHFDWHSDMHDEPYGPDWGPMEGLVRKLTFSLQLRSADTFEGGRFQIEYGPPDDPDRVRTIEGLEGPGSLLVFPSFLYHRVTPVSEGVRKALVGWVLGPPYR